MGVAALYHSWWDGDGVPAQIEEPVVPGGLWTYEPEPTGAWVDADIYDVTVDGVVVTAGGEDVTSMPAGAWMPETEPSGTWTLDDLNVTVDGVVVTADGDDVYLEG